MNNQNKISFKVWFFNESKAIVFPPEIQQKLHDIANKMLPILIELKKEEGKIESDKYKFVDTNFFNIILILLSCNFQDLQVLLLF